MKNYILISALLSLSFALLITSCAKQSNAPSNVTTFSVGDTTNFQGTAIWVYGTHNGVPFTANIAPNVIASHSYEFPQDLTQPEFDSLYVSVVRPFANTALSFALGASYSEQGQQVFPLRYMNVQFQTDGAGYINGTYSPSDTINIKEYAIYTLP